MLKPSSAVIAGLGVAPGRSAGYPNLFAGADHRHPVGRTRQRLAIRAVAYRYLLWIDLGLIGHQAAMALSFDIHLQLRPLQREPVRAKKRRPKAPFYQFFIWLSAWLSA